MTNMFVTNNRLLRRATGVFLMGAVVLRWVGIGFADATTDLATSTTKQEAITATEEKTLETGQRQAQKISEERQAKKFLFLGEISQGVGFEKNPLYTASEKSDGFIEDTLLLFGFKQLTPTITWQGFYLGDYTGYRRLTDAVLTFSTLTPVKLVWQPNSTWTLDGGVGLGYLWFPKDRSAGYRELNPNMRIKQKLWGTWYHALLLDYSLRKYIAAHARDGSGTNQVTHRQDSRPRVRYEVGTIWRNTSLKVRNEWYWNESNDQSQDFYDTRDYKLVGSLSRPLTQKLSVEASYSYELRNYLHRAVGGVSPDRARHDDIDTWNAALTYDLNPTWSVSPSFNYTRDRSNEPTGKYFDYTTELTLTAHF